MPEKEEVVGYYTEDGNIYCVECINRNIELMKKIDHAITIEGAKDSVYFCEGREKEIK
jgi:hypothetical protein